MEVEVYADLLFLINAGMDALCFFLTGRCLHRRLRPRRILVAATLGGLYAVVSLFMTVGSGLIILLDVLACLTMGVIVFAHKPNGTGDVLLPTAVFCLVSMILGGVMTSLYSLLNRMHADEWIPEGEDGAGAWLFALLALAGCGITLWGGRLMKRHAAQIPCRVTVEMDGRSIELEGLVDTGNRLRDPWNGRPVICVQADRITKILSPSLSDALRSTSGIALGSESSSVSGSGSGSGSTDARRLRLIPAGSALGHGMLMGFIPDHVLLAYALRGKERVTEVTVTIAVSKGLTEVQALVPAELI